MTRNTSPVDVVNVSPRAGSRTFPLESTSFADSTIQSVECSPTRKPGNGASVFQFVEPRTAVTSTETPVRANVTDSPATVAPNSFAADPNVDRADGIRYLLFFGCLAFLTTDFAAFTGSRNRDLIGSDSDIVSPA
jgi:hypothetical protein